MTTRSLADRLRHRMALVAVVSLCVGASVGGAVPTAAQSPEPITVMTLGEGIFGAPFVNLADEFTAETGIPVNMVTLGYDEEILKTNAAFAAKSDEFDVIQADYIFVKGWANAGHLEPLDNWLSADELNDYFSDVPQSVKDMYDWEGHPVGMGTIGNSQKFVYNVAALNEAGLAVPTTWDELLTAAQTIKAAGKQAGFTAGLEKLVKATGVWLPIFIANGGEVFDSTMHPQVNSQAGKDALSFLLKLVETMPDGGAAFTEGDEIKSIATGTATLDPVAWVPDGYTTATPDVQAQLEFGVQPTGSVRAAPVMGGLGLTVSAYSKTQGRRGEVRRVVQLEEDPVRSHRRQRRPAGQDVRLGSERRCEALVQGAGRQPRRGVGPPANPRMGAGRCCDRHRDGTGAGRRAQRGPGDGPGAGADRPDHARRGLLRVVVQTADHLSRGVPGVRRRAQDAPASSAPGPFRRGRCLIRTA